MTQDKRDWQKDMEMADRMRTGSYGPETLPALFHWLQQAASEKARADAAEAREQRLKELMKDALGCMVMFAGKDDDHVQRIVKVFRTLYPDTPAPKEGSHETEI